MANALREEVAAAERRLDEERSSHVSARHRSPASLCFSQVLLRSCTHFLVACVLAQYTPGTVISRCIHIYLSE